MYSFFVLLVSDINTISCLPLSSVSRGYLICSRSATSKLWRDRRKVPNRPGTRCFLKCPHGYQLRGEYELTCRSDGTWDGAKYGKCISEYRVLFIKKFVLSISQQRAEKSPGSNASISVLFLSFFISLNTRLSERRMHFSYNSTHDTNIAAQLNEFPVKSTRRISTNILDANLFFLSLKNGERLSAFFRGERSTGEYRPLRQDTTSPDWSVRRMS